MSPETRISIARPYDVRMQPYVVELLALIDATVPRLERLSDAEAARRPAPARWSPKEVIGHLIDSASNNHQRFVRAQMKDDLLCEGYRQDEWVACQAYAQAPWLELVTLWAHYNRHLARVMAHTPESERSRPRMPHNLDRIAMDGVPASAPATLDYLMADYVKHLRHHVNQVLPMSA